MLCEDNYCDDNSDTEKVDNSNIDYHYEYLFMLLGQDCKLVT